jgi:hypothetical protein
MTSAISILAAAPETSGSMLVMIGSVVAALIAGSFSYVTLISTKEQNVSQMRSQWIEGITEDLAKLFSEIELLIRLVEVELPVEGQPLARQHLKVFRNRHKENYERMNEAFALVRLRLDSSKHQDILHALGELHRLFYGDCHNTPEIMKTLDVLTAKTQIIAQDVWKTIRTGDTQYRRLSAFIIVIVAALVLALITFLYIHSQLAQAPRIQMAPEEMQ